jgi:hypothetical protein
MGGAVKKIAPIALGIGMAATGVGAFAAPAALGAGLGAAASTSALGAAAGSLAGLGAAAGVAAGAGSLLSTAGSIFSGAQSIIGSVSNIGGASAAPAATYAGAQSTAYAARQASRDQLSSAENLEYQSGVSLINKSIADLNLQFEQEVNAINQERVGRDNRRTLEKGKTMFALSGVDATGSVQDVLADTATEGALNLAIMDFESRHRQKGFEIQSSSFAKESENYIKASNKAKENAATILKEGLAASKGETSMSYIQGVQAIPQVLDGISDLANWIGS